MDSWLDTVDEQDNIIGKELKSKCHKEKILHRGADVLAFKDSSFKKLLLQKRSKEILTMPGRLCIPGGHLDLGETYFEGAKREFFEEMHNSKTKDLTFEKLFKFRKDADEDPEFLTIFRTVDPGPFDPDPKEVEEYFFEDINVLLSKIETHPKDFTGTTIVVLNEYKKRFLK